jgi:hypothetical protein
MYAECKCAWFHVYKGLGIFLYILLKGSKPDFDGGIAVFLIITNKVIRIPTLQVTSSNHVCFICT